MATTKDISEYTYEELSDHLKKLKVAAIESTKEALDAARIVVLDLEVKLEGLTGLPLTPKKTRKVRGPNKNKFPSGKPTKTKKGLSTKDAIVSALAHGPLKAKEIVAKTKLNPGTVNQALVVLKKSKAIKQTGEKGSPYSLK